MPHCVLPINLLLSKHPSGLQHPRHRCPRRRATAAKPCCLTRMLATVHRLEYDVLVGCMQSAMLHCNSFLSLSQLLTQHATVDTHGSRWLVAPHPLSVRPTVGWLVARSLCVHYSWFVADAGCSPDCWSTGLPRRGLPLLPLHCCRAEAAYHILCLLPITSVPSTGHCMCFALLLHLHQH
jgi:hypothetical protein